MHQSYWPDDIVLNRLAHVDLSKSYLPQRRKLCQIKGHTDSGLVPVVNPSKLGTGLIPSGSSLETVSSVPLGAINSTLAVKSSQSFLQVADTIGVTSCPVVQHTKELLMKSFGFEDGQRLSAMKYVNDLYTKRSPIFARYPNHVIQHCFTPGRTALVTFVEKAIELFASNASSLNMAEFAHQESLLLQEVVTIFMKKLEVEYNAQLVQEAIQQQKDHLVMLTNTCQAKSDKKDSRKPRKSRAKPLVPNIAMPNAQHSTLGSGCGPLSVHLQNTMSCVQRQPSILLNLQQQQQQHLNIPQHVDYHGYYSPRSIDTAHSSNILDKLEENSTTNKRKCPEDDTHALDEEHSRRSRRSSPPHFNAISEFPQAAIDCGVDDNVVKFVCNSGNANAHVTVHVNGSDENDSDDGFDDWDTKSVCMGDEDVISLRSLSTMSNISMLWTVNSPVPFDRDLLGNSIIPSAVKIVTPVKSVMKAHSHNKTKSTAIKSTIKAGEPSFDNLYINEFDEFELLGDFNLC